MNRPIRLTVELFGAFRQYARQESLELSLLSGSGLSDLRMKLELELQRLNPEAPVKGLIDASAFADERAILDERTLLDRDMTLAVLPPVCGG